MVSEQEATLVLIKPDAIKRQLTGAVLGRLAEAKLSMVGAKLVRVTKELAEAHYQPLRDKPFFGELIQYLCGELHRVDHVLALVYSGPAAIAKIRQLAGATNPEAAEPTSIRGGFGRVTSSGVMENVLHASSDAQEAKREITLWFHPEELLVSLYPTTTVESACRTVEWETPTYFKTSEITAKTRNPAKHAKRIRR